MHDAVTDQALADRSFWEPRGRRRFRPVGQGIRPQVGGRAPDDGCARLFRGDDPRTFAASKHLFAARGLGCLKLGPGPPALRLQAAGYRFLARVGNSVIRRCAAPGKAARRLGRGMNPAGMEVAQRVRGFAGRAFPVGRRVRRGDVAELLARTLAGGLADG